MQEQLEKKRRLIAREEWYGPVGEDGQIESYRALLRTKEANLEDAELQLQAAALLLAAARSSTSRDASALAREEFRVIALKYEEWSYG